MEELENTARRWLQAQQNMFTCSVENKNGALFFTVFLENGANDPLNVTFTVNQDPEANTWTVWSDHPDLQPKLDQILEFCESSRQRNIEAVLGKVFSVVRPILQDVEDDNAEDDNADDGDGDGDYYYDDDDEDEEQMSQSKTDAAKHDTSDCNASDDEDSRFFGGGASAIASHRLMKDLKCMKREAHQFCIDGNPRGDNLFMWDVKLTSFPSDTKLGQDIAAWAKKFNREPVVYLEMQFPADYPMKPPFVRVIRPRFKFLTGHVTIGGSICMEMLTSTGWTPSNDIEGILVQIRSEIMSDPNSRLDSNPDKAYNEQEARDAFQRMVQRYGWKS